MCIPVTCDIVPVVHWACARQGLGIVWGMQPFLLQTLQCYTQGSGPHLLAESSLQAYALSWVQLRKWRGT